MMSIGESHKRGCPFDKKFIENVLIIWNYNSCKRFRWLIKLHYVELTNCSSLKSELTRLQFLWKEDDSDSNSHLPKYKQMLIHITRSFRKYRLKFANLSSNRSVLIFSYKTAIFLKRYFKIVKSFQNFTYQSTFVLIRSYQ